MRLLSWLGAAAVAIMIDAVPAHSQIVDIQQPNLATVSGFDFATQWSIQSFVPSLVNSAGGGVWVRYQGASIATATGVLDMELWTGIPGVGGASRLASNTTAFSVTGDGHNGGGHYVDVFWNAVGVTSFTTQYFLVFSATMDNPADAASVVFGYSGQNSNPYPGGDQFFQSIIGGSIADSYNEWMSDDFTFRTYASTDVIPPTNPVSTPEPASIVLLATGLVGLTRVAHRRRPN